MNFSQAIKRKSLSRKNFTSPDGKIWIETAAGHWFEFGNSKHIKSANELAQYCKDVKNCIQTH